MVGVKCNLAPKLNPNIQILVENNEDQLMTSIKCIGIK